MIIECESLVKVYGQGENEFHALKGVSFSVSKGDFFAIMGPSGCGKTTLLNVFGLLDRSTSGTYRLEGQDVSEFQDYRRSILRRSKIGFVFQSFNLLPRMTALHNVVMPMTYAGVPRAERPERAAGLLKRVGLAGKEKNTPLELSGGEKQRVAIARALANHPSIILADEPTGNLDSVSSAGIMDFLASLNADGMTIVVVTHDPNICKGARRAIKLKDGLIEQ